MCEPDTGEYIYFMTAGGSSARAQGAIFTTSHDFQNYTRTAVSSLRPVQSHLISPRRRSITVQTLQTQLSQSRVFPLLSLSSETRSVRDRRSHRVPEKSLAVILVTILREFSHLIACSAMLQSTHCRMGPSPLQHSCYH